MARAGGLLLLALLMLTAAAPILASHQLTETPEPDAADVLERMDRTLAPLDARITDVIADIGATSGELSKAYTTALRETAVLAWGVVSSTPVHACYAQFHATLRVTYALIADSVDAYQDKAPDWQRVGGAAFYLWDTLVPLERGATTCEPAPTPTPTGGS